MPLQMARPSPSPPNLPGRLRPPLLKRIEHYREVVWVNADSSVPDSHPNEVIAGHLRCDDDFPTDRRELGGVVNEIPEDLLEPCSITNDCRVRGMEVKGNGNILFRKRLRTDVDCMAHHPMKVAAILLEHKFAVRDSCHIQQVVDEPRLEFHISPDHFQVLAKRGICDPFLDQRTCGEEYPAKAGAELVAEC